MLVTEVPLHTFTFYHSFYFALAFQAAEGIFSSLLSRRFIPLFFLFMSTVRTAYIVSFCFFEMALHFPGVVLHLYCRR